MFRRNQKITIDYDIKKKGRLSDQTTPSNQV